MGDKLPQPDTAGPRLKTVIGNNANRLRTTAGLTLDQVSIAARKHGLNWSESRVADFESGRVAPNLATLIAVCLALADAGCADATLAELLHTESLIRINDSLLLSNEQVVNLLSGGTVGARNPQAQAQVGVSTSASSLPLSELMSRIIKSVETVSVTQSVLTASGATEERTRKALGLSPTELADWSATLWKRSFSQERDRRAGQEAKPQKRGQVSRQMRKELRAAIEAATHGDDK